MAPCGGDLHPADKTFSRTHDGFAALDKETSGYHTDFVDSVCFVHGDRPQAGANFPGGSLVSYLSAFARVDGRV